MKQFDIKKQRELGGNMYYIRPFPAFISANLSGELSSLILPLLASAMPLLGGSSKDVGSIMEMEAETVAPMLAGGLSSLNGDKVETLLKKLIVKHGNISVQLDGEHDTQKLTEDIANEVFCGDAQDMFILAWDVVKVNFSGFFTKVGGLFGNLPNMLLQKSRLTSEGTDT